MNTRILNKSAVFALVVILMMTFVTQNIGYAQEGIPTLTATTVAPLTEANLGGSVVILNLSGRTFAHPNDIRDALIMSGIDGALIYSDSFVRHEVYDPITDSSSYTRATFTLWFSGNIHTDTTLTFTLGAKAINNYNQAFSFQLPVTAVEESLVATTVAPLTEANLGGSVVTLNLSGRTFAHPNDIRDALVMSGIDGALIYSDSFVRHEVYDPITDSSSYTRATFTLWFSGNIHTDATLTFTLGAKAINNYNQVFTFQLPVTTVEESLIATTASPLTEANLHNQVVTLNLSGRTFAHPNDIRDALVMSGIDGAFIYADSFARHEVYDPSTDSSSYTRATFRLWFSGNIHTDATLTFTLGAKAINNYNQAFTFQLPVTAVEESLVATTVAPSTNIITLTLSGRTFAHPNDIRDALTISGIDGTFIYSDSVARHEVYDPNTDSSSYTRATFSLGFSGDIDNIDTDAKLTLTLGASAIISYNQAFTVQLPVLVIKEPFVTVPMTPTNVVVRISPNSVASPAIGEQLVFSLNISHGEVVAGYQATVEFDDTALSFVSSTNGDYLPTGSYFVEPVVAGNVVRLTAVTLAGESKGDGTLATLTFNVIAEKASNLTLSDVLLTNSAGEAFVPNILNAEITGQLKGDVNGDGTVNLQDLVFVASHLGKTGTHVADVNDDRIVNIQDLVLVAGAFETGAAAPSLYAKDLPMLTAADVNQWLFHARRLNLTDVTSRSGILFLQQLLEALTPKETVLLPNYPNPFNPETWIPYRLAQPAAVTLTIYAVDGSMVRTLDLGHQSVGMYQTRNRAAHWDGRNSIGEMVATGVYFYTLNAGDFTATRRMLIRK